MNKKILVAIIAGVLILGGSGAFLMSRSSDDSSSSIESSSQAESETQKEASDTPLFNPLSTQDQSFVATISTQGEAASGGVMEYDSQNKSIRFVTTTDEGSMTLYYTQDAYYFCQNETTCYKTALGQGNSVGFDASAYEYTTDELSAYKNSAQYKGQESCKAGRCDVWQVSTDLSGTGTYQTSLYLDVDTHRISQVEGASASGTTSIIYEYKDVNVTPPANAQEFPSLQGIGN